MVTEPHPTLPSAAARADAVAVSVRAEQLLVASLAATTPGEQRQQARLAGVVQDARLRELTFALTDEVLRFTSSRRAAARFRAIGKGL